ncbi:hypothetical protein JIG36_26445 [Actinoplanes sp. LDG1-06]|uniref:Ribosomally synthesized peptide with SipW-like signal peptide n=1 Tax=Paractinoplanes ovalisporus TaxID=2810368 RepID=A0ABS2AIR3_9ACTN|nr:hypothetical protein [Actinoplanes ovalisporus]MBM2619101.1 hypothetical protein [Actinoplanes ovalisporus]
MRKSTKRVVVIATTLAVAGGASAAWASWLANGTGTAAAKAGTAQELVVTSATPDASLFPETVGNAWVTIENPNPYAVSVDKLTWKPSDGVQTVATVAGSVCGNNGVYFGDFSTSTIGSGGVLSGLDLYVPGGESKSFELKKAVRMINNAENGCQGATFSIPLKATGESVVAR